MVNKASVGVFLTDVYDVTFTVNHDITIVTILNLQNITSHRVRGHGLNEV